MASLTARRGVIPKPNVPAGEPINAAAWRRSLPPERVLAIRLQAMGDTIATLPYLLALQRAIPGVRLDFVTRRAFVDVPGSVDLFDRVYALGGGRSTKRQLLSALGLLPGLALRRYDVVIDLQRNRVSRLIRRVLNPHCWAEFDRYSPVLGGERIRQTIEATGLGSLTVTPDLRLRAPDAGAARLRAAGWQPGAILVALNPAGGFSGRNWPLESYVEFGDGLAAALGGSVQFVVTGTPAIAPKVAVLRGGLGARLLDLIGTTLPEAFSIIKRCSLMVSEDGGLMHAAWVLGVPTIGLFGASRWVWARPHGNYSELLNACRQPDGVCMDGRCRAGSPTCLAKCQPHEAVALAVDLLSRSTRMRKAIYEPRGT
ncbi:MAG TPA: glycosyltransferase family 9 protein [Gemmatimonadaceae bacterium]|nr:glycosyltransferase family 9 protein [Gemmatimonadaceae bacterium]